MIAISQDGKGIVHTPSNAFLDEENCIWVDHLAMAYYTDQKFAEKEFARFLTALTNGEKRFEFCADF